MTDPFDAQVPVLPGESGPPFAPSESVPEAKRLQLLYQIGQELSSSLNIHEVMSRVLALATENVRAFRGSIFLLDRQGEVSHRILVRQDLLPVVATQAVKSVLERGLAGWVIRERQGTIVRDVRDDPRWLILPGDAAKPESVIAVPILRGPDVLGLITLHHSEAGHFSDDHLTFLTAIANQAAIALENARLYTEQERIVEERTRAVVETTNFLRSVLDSAVDYAIVAVDSQGVFISWNEGARRMFGYTAEEVVGQATTDVFYGPHFLEKPPHHNLLKAILDAQEDSSPMSHLQFAHRDGHSFPVDVRATVIRSITGEPVGILGIIRDVTEQLELERAKTQFVANVSHELCTPIDVLKLRLANLMRHYHRLDDETRLELLDEANQQVSYLQQLAEDILVLSQIDVGTLIIQADPFDLSQIVRQLVADFEEIAAAQEIELTHQGLDTPVRIVGEPMRMAQVVKHLLRNALKFTPDGGKVRVNLTSAEETVQLSVQDTGPGIPASEHYRIFERFYRGSTATADKMGSGLGLAIVKQTVEAYGGRIEVQSEEGSGSTFIVTLSQRLLDK